MVLLLKLLLIFIMIIILLNKKIKLSYTMLIASLTVAIAYKVMINSVLDVIYRTLTDKEAIKIILLLVLIMYLEKVMSSKKLMSNMVVSLKNVIGDNRITSLILPAVIGILPSTGGAIFSAPMLDEVYRGINVENEIKSFVNYWYRHIWEFVFPINSGLLIASAVLNIKIVSLIKLLYPYTFLNILVGLPIAFYYFPKDIKFKPVDIHKNLLCFLLNSYPITIILSLFFIFKIDIIITIIIVLFLVLLNEKVSIMEFWHIITKDKSISFITTVISILIFKNLLIESKIIEYLPSLFCLMGIKDVYIAFLLPLLIGIFTGMMSAAVGITLPIVMNLGNGMDLNLITVAFVSCYVGTMMSPMHLCFTLSTEFFNADFNKVWIRIASGQMFIALCSLFYFLVFIG